MESEGYGPRKMAEAPPHCNDDDPGFLQGQGQVWSSKPEPPSPWPDSKRRRELLDLANTIADLVEARVPPGPERCLLRRMTEALLGE